MRSRRGLLQCSYSVCLKKLGDNRRAVEEFADRWRALGLSEMFQCYYDTMDPSRVIVEKMYSINDVIHSMTWPSLVVVFCGLIFLRLQTRRHKLTLCGRRGTSTSQTAVNDVVKQPLRQHQQQEDNEEEQYSEDHHSDSDDRKDSSSYHNNPTTSYIRPTTSSAVDAAGSDDVFNDDDMRCDEDTESHLTPQLCYTSSSSSASSSVAPADHDGGLPLVLSASSPALDEDARQTESTTSRPLSTSRSAADLTT